MKRKLIACVLATFVSGLGISVLAADAPTPKPDDILAPGVSRVTSPPVSKTAGQSRRAGGDPVDDRVEIREYGFKETNENLPYAIFVSTKVTKEEKAPLVLALHGMGGNYGTFMRTACVDEAEKHGYILVGPMGYSPNGSFGMQFGGARGGRGPAPARGAMTPPPSPADPGAPAGGMPARGMGGARGAMPAGGRGPAIGGTAETDSTKVAELSEKDALNVLEMVCKEYNVDENRIYLMGHSLGGGGSLHMGNKHAQKWAGVAALAPAAFGFSWTADSKLKNVPLLIAQGEDDTLVRPESARQLYDQMKNLGFKVELKVMSGMDHGSIIAGAQAEAYKFFENNVKNK